MYFVRAQEKQPPNYSASSSSFKKSSFAQEASLKSDYGEDFTIGTGVSFDYKAREILALNCHDSLWYMLMWDLLTLSAHA